MLGQVVLKLKNFFPDVPMAVATTTNPKDNPIVEFCKQKNIDFFRGSENDVLSRTIATANAYGFDQIIRVCSDNPFLYPKFIETLVNDLSGSDYVSYQVDNTPTIRTHYGLFVERVKTTSLQRAAAMSPNAFYREHVTNFIYENPDKFSIQWIGIKDYLNELHDLRLTIDNPDDFELVSKLYEDLVGDDTFFELEKLKSHLLAHPEKLKKMARTKEMYNK